MHYVFKIQMVNKFERKKKTLNKKEKESELNK